MKIIHGVFLLSDTCFCCI